MMTLKDLYMRVKDTTNLQVLTVSDMYTMYQNCAADLTGRGYREFVELEALPRPETEVPGEVYYDSELKRKFTMPAPANLRKLLYVRIDTGEGLIKGQRIPVTNPFLGTVSVNGVYLYDFYNAHSGDAVFYIKNNKLVLETAAERESKKIVVGMYKKIDKYIIPTSWETTDELGNPVTSTDVYDANILETITLPVREDLEDLFVLYGVYFCYNKYLKEETVVDRHLKNYKYGVEDLLHELNYEDDFNEEECVIITDY